MNLQGENEGGPAAAGEAGELNKVAKLQATLQDIIGITNANQLSQFATHGGIKTLSIHQ